MCMAPSPFVHTCLWQFFGDYTGTFRAYPGRTQETCGDYDPRRRPWYVAASSGPKDVVVVIDTSGSMDNGFPTKLIDDAKAAAKQVIGRLTMADFFTVIRFSNEATNLADATFGADRGLVRATKENVDKMIAAIDAIVHNGSTNYIGAFEKVRQAMDTGECPPSFAHVHVCVPVCGAHKQRCPLFTPPHPLFTHVRGPLFTHVCGSHMRVPPQPPPTSGRATATRQSCS